MIEPSKLRSYIILHATVFIWGITPILGKGLIVKAIPLVWYRVLIAVPAILLYLLYKQVNLNLPRRAALQLLGISALIAAHWFAFYTAIKISNISVTMACFSCGAFFSALLEPLVFKRKISWVEIGLGLLVMVGISYIFSVEFKYVTGMILSVLAALGAACFSVLNGVMVKRHDSRVIALYELSGVFLFTTLYLLLSGDLNSSLFDFGSTEASSSLFLNISPFTMNIAGLLFFGLICTALTFITSVEVMKKISPYTVNLTVNLEVVYSIIWAILIFGQSEYMSVGFYVGTSLVFIALIANGWYKSQARKV